MLLSDVFIILVLCLLGWLWWLDRGFRQSAFIKCKQHCEHAGVELLDENIQIRKISIRKNKKGRWQIYRRFSFEFTSTYEKRYQGTLETLGNIVINIELEPHRI